MPDVAARIEVENVSKVYQRPGRRDETFTAVADINLRVGVGEFVSLVGASGCGKTTLLRMMAGLVGAETGSIRINGRTVVDVPPSIGFVFQDPALLPWRTVRENLAFALKHKKLSGQALKAAIDDKLELTNLQDFAEYLPHTMSGGMQQRAGLARALAIDPDVLFMDEPLSALDAFTRRRLQQEIATIIATTGTTTVLVTHDVDEAVFFSDRIVVMGTSPGSVREIVDVPFSRPRNHADLLGNPDVAELRDGVLKLILGFE
jgi:ABC-type nitrate/sulfonate/bicarbonate transport system ATPase subunit